MYYSTFIVLSFDENSVEIKVIKVGEETKMGTKQIVFGTHTK